MSFAARHPRAWHLVEGDGLAGVRREGLLPAALLKARAGIADGGNREAYRRIGEAVLRPQYMRDQRLLPSLHGRFAGDAAAWRGFVDAHVFFWADEARVAGFVGATRRMRQAQEPGAPPPVLLEFDTAALLAGLAAPAFFTRVNSGSTLRGGARIIRDEALFQPVAAWRAGRAAELAVRGPVPAGALRAALRRESVAA